MSRGGEARRRLLFGNGQFSGVWVLRLGEFILVE